MALGRGELSVPHGPAHKPRENGPLSAPHLHNILPKTGLSTDHVMPNLPKNGGPSAQRYPLLYPGIYSSVYFSPLPGHIQQGVPLS